MTSMDIEKRPSPSDDGTDSKHEEKSISVEHQEYLMQRHGTVELDPMPSSDPKDPLNWPDIKKNYHLILVAFQAMTSTFMAAGIVPAYESMAVQYGKTVPTISYLTSVQILIMGIFPIIWLPLMNKYGRRPFLAISVLGSMAFNIGGGFCTTFGAQMATRALTAFFISPACAVGSAVVTEICFSYERGRKNGWWSVMITVGTPAGPFMMGFVQQHAGTKWIYFTFAIMNFVQFLLWLFADETLYNREMQAHPTASNGEKARAFFGFNAKSPNEDVLGIRQRVLNPIKAKNDLKLDFWYFLRPFKQFAVYQVCVATIAYAIVFCYANIVLVVEMPQVMGAKFHLDAQATGLQFLAIIIGSIIGEMLSGPLSDYWMKICIKRRGVKLIEDRLWISYNGFITIMFGLIIWGVKLQQAKEGQWTITPLIGAAFAAGGNQIVTTAVITYCVDVDFTKSVETGLFINLIRQIWGFIGPFYFPKMFENLGFGGSGGLLCGLVGVCAMLPVAIIHFIGWRRFKQVTNGIPVHDA